MNRFILSILAVSFPLQLLGQMFPLSDHYVYNALAINPAFAGCHDALSATILYRNCKNRRFWPLFAGSYSIDQTTCEQSFNDQSGWSKYSGRYWSLPSIFPTATSPNRKTFAFIPPESQILISQANVNCASNRISAIFGTTLCKADFRIDAL